MKAIHVYILVFFLSLTLNACGGGGDDNPQTGTVTLDWDIPTSKKNGDALALSEIGGYRIYASTNGSTLSKLTDVADSSKTQHVIRVISAASYAMRNLTSGLMSLAWLIHLHHPCYI